MFLLVAALRILPAHPSRKRKWFINCRRSSQEKGGSCIHSFFSESNSAALQALTDKSDANVRLQKVAGLLSQVQLVSSDVVYKKAVDMFEILINMYSLESAKDTNKIYADFRELFVIVARAELGLRSQQTV